MNLPGPTSDIGQAKKLAALARGPPATANTGLAKIACDHDRVRLSSNEYVLGLNGRSDHPDGTSQHVGFVDALRESRLITRNRNCGMRYIAA